MANLKEQDKGKPQKTTPVKTTEDGNMNKGMKTEPKTPQQENLNQNNLPNSNRGRGRGGFQQRGGFNRRGGFRGGFNRGGDGQGNDMNRSMQNQSQAQGQAASGGDNDNFRKGPQDGNFKGRRDQSFDRREKRERPSYPPAQFTEDGERMFTGRCRLFIGNLPNDITEEAFKAMFEEYGQTSEAFLNAGRGFGFVRLDTVANATKAKKALDGQEKNGRLLRVRFATHGAAVRVKHLPPHVTNELLTEAFSMFGEIEKAVVIIDDKGKPTGEGIVEYCRKPGASSCFKRITEGVFLMGASPRPVIVEPLVENDEFDGLSEKFVNKNQEYHREREQAPRFANIASFEFEFGQKWKELYQMHEEQQEQLKRQFEEAVAKLEIEQANGQMEEQTKKLREDLLRRQEELRVLEESHKMEMQRKLEMRQQQQESMRRRMEEERRLEEEMKMRRQNMFNQRGNDRGNMPPMNPPPVPPGLKVDNRGDESMNDMGRRGGNMSSNNMPSLMGNQSTNRNNMGGGNNQMMMGEDLSDALADRMLEMKQNLDTMSRNNMNMGNTQGNNMANQGTNLMAGARNQGNMRGGSRFNDDNNMNSGNMGGGMGNQGNMMGNMGGNQGNMASGNRGPMGGNRMMDRRDRRGGANNDHFFENKRQRRM